MLYFAAVNPHTLFGEFRPVFYLVLVFLFSYVSLLVYLSTYKNNRALDENTGNFLPISDILSVKKENGRILVELLWASNIVSVVPIQNLMDEGQWSCPQCVSRFKAESGAHSELLLLQHGTSLSYTHVYRNPSRMFTLTMPLMWTLTLPPILHICTLPLHYMY